MKSFRWLLAPMLVWSGLAFGAQDEVEIVHDTIGCWPVDEFLLIQSSFAPPEDIQTVKFYFRSIDQPDYYYVELTLGQGGGRAIAPKANPSTSGVTYYIEIVTRSFSSFRTEERDVPVASGDECKRRDPETAYYTGENPDIAIGATRAGVPQMPPGFQSEGISRFMSITGSQGGTGGGVSGKTVGIIAGIGGGAGAALLLSGGGGSDTTTSAIGGITTSSPSSSSTSTAIGGVTSTTTTGGGGSSTSSATTTVVGGGSTTTVLGSTTTVFGSSTTTVIGGSTTTTVVGGSTTTSVGTSTTTSVIGSSTTTSGPGSTTSIPSSTTSSPTTTTSSPTTTTSSPTTTTSSPTTTTSSPTTTTSSPTTTTSSPTTTTSQPSTTTSVRTTTTSAPASSADVRITKVDTVDPVPRNQAFDYVITVTNGGPGSPNAVGVEDQLPSGMNYLGSQGVACLNVGGGLVRCAMGSFTNGQSKTVRIRVSVGSAGNFSNTATVSSTLADPNQSNNTAVQRTTVQLALREPDAAGWSMAYKTTLQASNGTLRGRVVANDTHFQTFDSSGPQVANLVARSGENQFEAHLDGPATADGFWIFDFHGSRGFVPGSLRVDSGELHSLDAYTVVFAIGPSRPPLRFRFELGDESTTRRPLQ